MHARQRWQRAPQAAAAGQHTCLRERGRLGCRLMAKATGGDLIDRGAHHCEPTPALLSSPHAAPQVHLRRPTAAARGDVASPVSLAHMGWFVVNPVMVLPCGNRHPACSTVDGCRSCFGRHVCTQRESNQMAPGVCCVGSCGGRGVTDQTRLFRTLAAFMEARWMEHSLFASWA